MRLSLSVTGALIGAGLLALSGPAAAAPISGAMPQGVTLQTQSGAAHWSSRYGTGAAAAIIAAIAVGTMARSRPA